MVSPHGLEFLLIQYSMNIKLVWVFTLEHFHS